MAKITLQGTAIETVGELPEVGKAAPDFTLVKGDMSDVKLSDYAGKTVVLNIFPSVETPVCATAVREFNAAAADNPNAVVLCISADLPFAQERFCGAEGLKDVITLSTFRNPEFGTNYGVVITTGPIAELMSRAVVVVAADGTVKYTEQVPEIAQEPNYAAALAAMK